MQNPTSKKRVTFKKYNEQLLCRVIQYKQIKLLRWFFLLEILLHKFQKIENIISIKFLLFKYSRNLQKVFIYLKLSLL